MNRMLTLSALLLALGACGNDTNPYTGGKTGGGGSSGDSGISSDPVCDGSGRCVPPGTASPTPSGDIVRMEEKDGSGNGYAESAAYDPASDTFSVDGLGFDGDNTYTRGTAVGSLGPFAVYEGASTYADAQTGTLIDQYAHRAIYAVSRSGATEFAIVRTGGYIDYGFGGYVYKRNGGVTLPSDGQANYAGDYAALRDFNDRGGLQYATADMNMSIDFKDFNDGPAVRGSVYNRRIYDINGNDITQTVLDQFNLDHSTALSDLPVMTFTVGPGAGDVNGEIVGAIGSRYADSTGAVQTFESGNYYAILSDGSGAAASEVVGVIVVSSDNVRETGGFVLYRN